jgi:hypothetical protein
VIISMGIGPDLSPQLGMALCLGLGTGLSLVIIGPLAVTGLLKGRRLYADAAKQFVVLAFVCG